MKKRAWISAKIECEVEWDEKDEFGYNGALKDKLADAEIAEYSNVKVEEKTAKFECDECLDFKDGSDFRKGATVCDDCVENLERQKAEETDDRDDIRCEGGR